MKKFLVLGALSLFCLGGDVSAMNGNINAGPQVNNILRPPLDGLLVDYQEKLNTIIRKGLEYTGELGQAEQLHNMLQNAPDASCFYPPWREFIRAQCDIDEAAIEFKGTWSFITNNAIPQPDIRKEASATIRRARAIFVERLAKATIRRARAIFVARLANANTPATIREAIEDNRGGLRLEEESNQELNLDTLTRDELVEMLVTVLNIIRTEREYIEEIVVLRQNSIHASVDALFRRINNGWLEGFVRTVDATLQAEVCALKQRRDDNKATEDELNRLRELERQLDEFNNCRRDLQNAAQALSARYLAEMDAYFENIGTSDRLFTHRTDIQTHIQRAMDELLARCRAEVDTYFNEEDGAGTLLTRRADIQEHVQRLIRERLARYRAEVDTYFNNADSIHTFFTNTEERICQTIDFLNEMEEDVHQ